MSTASSSSSSPADRQAGPDRAHLPRRHGDRSVRLARRPQGPRGHRLPGGGERLHGGADRRARRACGPRSSTRSRRAPRRPTCRCRCARGTGGGTRAPWRASSTRSTAAAWCATARSGRRCPRTASRWTARRCCSTATSWRRARRSSRSARCRSAPDEAAARLLDRLLRRRAVHAADQGPGDRRRRCPTRSLTRSTAAPGRWTASALFYVTVDEAWRPYRVWRHRVGTPASSDVMVFEESRRAVLAGVGPVPRRQVGLHLRGQQADQRMVAARRRRARGRVHRRRAAAAGRRVRRRGRRDRLLIVHNDGGAENFELATAPLPGTG